MEWIQSTIKKIRYINLIKLAIFLLVSMGTIIVIFIVPPTVEFTRQFYEVGLEKILFLICIFTLLLGKKGFWGETLSLTVTLVLFSLSLIYKWQTATSNSFMLGGLLPLSDAGSYYSNAQQLIYGFDISGGATFRPIHTAFLAVLLGSTGNNLQITLIILVTLNALAVYFATREIQRSFSSNVGAAIYLVLCYLFFRRFSGSVMTENLGFCLGNLALTYLLSGSRKNQINFVFFGLFLLTTALNVRAGAYFILPALALWMGISFRKDHGFWRTVIIGLTIIVFGMITNLTFTKLITSSGSIPLSNYSLVFYGLVSGNKGWEQAGNDHPGASYEQIFNFAIQKVKENPSLAFLGVVGAYQDYFATTNGAFSFLSLKHNRNYVANSILWGLSLAGLFVSTIKSKQKVFSICIAFFAGILLSVGLVPPADSGMMRAYAATIPFTACLVTTSFAIFNKTISADTERDLIGSGPLLPFSAAILIACFILPFIIQSFGDLPKPEKTISCPSGQKQITLLTERGSSIVLETDNTESYVPHLDISTFTKRVVLPELPLRKEIETFFMEMRAGAVITASQMAVIDSNNSLSFERGYLITKEIPARGVQVLCSTPDTLSNFYYMDLTSTETENPTFTQPLKNPLLITVVRFTYEIGLWLIFILVMLDLIELKNFTINKYPLVFLNALSIFVGILVFLHSSGLVPLGWERKLIDSNEIFHKDNFLYTVDIHNNAVDDTKFWDYPVNLYEDNAILGSPHEGQDIIALYGRGSYLIKDTYLYFSASDNSNPRTNGKQYEIEWPLQIRLRYQALFYIVTLLGLLIHFKYAKPILAKKMENDLSV